MNKFRMAALGAALMLGVGTAAQAQGRANGPSTPRGAVARDVAAGPLFRGITLSDAQKTRLRAVDQKYATLRQEMRRETRRARGAQRQRPDSATMVRTRELVERQQGELRSILTAEQQRTFDQNVVEVRERAKERGAKRGGEGRERAKAGRGGRRA